MGGGIGPWQEFVEAALRMAVDDAGDDGEVGVWIDAGQLCRFRSVMRRRPSARHRRRRARARGSWARSDFAPLTVSRNLRRPAPSRRLMQKTVVSQIVGIAPGQ